MKDFASEFDVYVNSQTEQGRQRDTINKLVYMAGPLFSQAERSYLENLVEVLAKATNLNPLYDFYVPHRDSAELDAQVRQVQVFRENVAGLERAKIVIAWLDGQDVDSGTSMEVGYACARGKVIIGLHTDIRVGDGKEDVGQRPNLMIVGACEDGHTLFRRLSDAVDAFVKAVEHFRNIRGTLL